MRKAAQDPAATYASSTDEQFALSQQQQQLSPKSVAACGAVIGEPTPPKQPRRLIKPTVKGSDTTSKPATSAEAARMRTSLDVSGPLSGTPIGTTDPHACVEKHSLPLATDATRHPFTYLGSENKRGFLTWMQARSSSGITAEQKGIRTTYAGALDGSQGVSFHTFSLTVANSYTCAWKTWEDAFVNLMFDSSWKP